MSEKLIIWGFQLFFCLFAELLDNIYVSIRDSYFYIRIGEDWPARKLFPLYFGVCLLQGIRCQAYLLLLFGDLLLIAVQEKGLIELFELPETYFMEKYQSFAISWVFISPLVWKFKIMESFASFTVLAITADTYTWSFYAVYIEQLNNSYWYSIYQTSCLYGLELMASLRGWI